MSEPTTSRPDSAAPGTLWCMHILGPDEVHAAPSRAHAEKAAAMFNAVMSSRFPDVKMEAVVVSWPHSAESHAENVDKFILEWLMPAWQVEAADTATKVLTEAQSGASTPLAPAQGADAIQWPGRMTCIPCPDGSGDRIVGFRIPRGSPLLGEGDTDNVLKPLAWLHSVTWDRQVADPSAETRITEFRNYCEEQSAPMDLVATLEACRDEETTIEISPQRLLDLFAAGQKESSS